MRLVLVYDSNNPNYASAHYQIIQSYHQDVNQAIKSVLEAGGHKVTLLEANQDLEEKLQNIQPDFAFNCSIKIDSQNEASYAPGVLKKQGIPFTGSGGIACLDAFEKDHTKKILKKARIRTPRAVVVQDGEHFSLPETLAFPLFVKPVKGGCSYGIGRKNLIRDLAGLRKKLPEIYRQVRQPLLLEEFLSGREFTLGVLGNRTVRVLPIMEFRYSHLDDREFRTYDLKMIHYDEEELRCPADLDEKTRAEMEAMALETYRAIGCRDYARVDIRMNAAGKPYVLEVNALPNLVPNTSSYAIMANKAGIPFKDLIQEIMKIAAKRYKK